MTSQLRHNFQASQAVHEAVDITALHFQTQVNSLSVCGPQVDALNYLRGLECPIGFAVFARFVDQNLLAQIPKKSKPHFSPNWLSHLLNQHLIDHLFLSIEEKDPALEFLGGFPILTYKF